MLTWIVWNRTIFIKIDLAFNNLQSLICHKTKKKKKKKKNIDNIVAFNLRI